MKFYLLKSKGNGAVPDQIQVRDRDFGIIGFFKATHPERGLKEIGLEENNQKGQLTMAAIKQLEYGRIVPVEL